MRPEIEFRQTVLAVVQKYDEEGRYPDAIIPVVRNSLEFASRPVGLLTEVMSLWSCPDGLTIEERYRVPTYLSNTGELITLGEITFHKGIPGEYEILTFVVTPLEEALPFLDDIKALL